MVIRAAAYFPMEHMDIVDVDGWSLKGLATVNVILGKNGCGKSTLLRTIDRLRDSIVNIGTLTYITPERSGTLEYQAHVEQELLVNAENVRSNRRNNQVIFKPQSVAQYRKLENLVQREGEAFLDGQLTDKPKTFPSYLSRLNTLLDELEVKRLRTGFGLEKKGGQSLPPGAISSGESELISLAIETLVFEKEAIVDKENLLLLDEPDVHLHPDLQVRLMDFIYTEVKAKSLRVVVATHSTAVLAALRGRAGVAVAFMRSGQRTLEFRAVSERLERVMPVFGAHPLSNVFNDAPILLVEGEDDERIWQQAIRTSKGRIHAYPCGVGTVTEFNDYEKEVRDIATAVYDKPRAFAVRDGDGIREQLNDEVPIVRVRLQCYAAENLLLSDEVLASLGASWQSVKAGIDHWLAANRAHHHHRDMAEFMAHGADRRDSKVKAIRNDLMGIIGSEKPWEVAVGQVIGPLRIDGASRFDVDGKILTFLGEKLCKALLT